MTWITSLWRRIRGEDGNATIEFVLLFPAFMTLFLTSFELGIFTMRSVLLERALDLNIRSMRLGDLSPATVDELKRRMCNEMIFFSDCTTDLAVDVRVIPTGTWTMPTGKIPCRNRVDGVDPANLLFTLGDDQSPTLLRACLVMDPFFGTTPFIMKMPRDASGGVTMSAWSAYVAEPS
ncbi:TadE/TadG family type IV pilus assembly protein [Aliiroseovarius lamellibrachiae]|uniref:TadE/TadG family type IV pilus assembly protein n=1 Tax=Aliiroseovarius lamellibrachiae TaxID=1924933 RepID=UPI001BE05C56|nr:TadE/TadG family type IV pilus assembly protein [Aliiroseovarius lamellibrachiae]MBT2131079.1 pilus assembly protein [Aliiroseovarius lamellibrachiae]